MVGRLILKKYFFLLVCLFFVACSSVVDRPVFGGEINIGLDTNDYDPEFQVNIASSGSSSYISLLIYSSLFRLTQSDELQPDLVEQFSVSPDKKIWEITLKENIKFHDGSFLTARDVKTTYDTIKQHPESQYFGDLQELDRVIVKSDQKLIFQLKKFDVFFVYALQLVAITKNGSINPDPNFIGTGAYSFDHYDAAKRVLVLSKNKNYYGNPAYLDRVHIHYLSNDLEVLSQFMQEKIDFMYLADPTYERLFEQNKNYQIVYPKHPIYYLMFVNRSPNHVLSDARVRNALSANIHRDHLLSQLQEYSQSFSLGWMKQAEDLGYDRALWQTQRHLAVATFSGHKLNDLIMHQLLQVFLPLNILIHPQVTDFPKFVQNVSLGRYDLALTPVNFSFEDMYFYNYLKEGEDAHSLTEDQLRVLDDVRYSTDDRLRKNSQKQIFQILDKIHPFIFLLQRKIPVVISRRFHGAHAEPVEVISEIPNLWRVQK